MIKINQNDPFIATWNERNKQLNPNHMGLFGRLAAKVNNVVFYLPNSFIAACVNPRNESPFYPSAELKQNFGDFRKEIITPDGIHLSAKVHVMKGATSNTPTVILFNPLGAGKSVHNTLRNELIGQKCNVVIFDYRGLGSTWRGKDLVVDGDSVYQYVIQELGTKKDKVNFFGFSLGAAISAQVKALHPESKGKYVGDRPFKSVFSLIKENCCIESLGWLIKKITSFVSAILIAYPVYLLGWEWDGSKALERLKGDWFVIYHPNDCLVPFDASLASTCTLEKVMRLNQNERGASTHFSTIDAHQTDEGKSAIDKVAQFLSH